MPSTRQQRPDYMMSHSVGVKHTYSPFVAAACSRTIRMFAEGVARQGQKLQLAFVWFFPQNEALLFVLTSELCSDNPQAEICR